jgi:hypothetical protein
MLKNMDVHHAAFHGDAAAAASMAAAMHMDQEHQSAADSGAQQLEATEPADASMNSQSIPCPICEQEFPSERHLSKHFDEDH